MPIDLYYVPGSGPCRSVQLAAAALGVDLNLKIVDLMGGEQLKPEFIKVTHNGIPSRLEIIINVSSKFSNIL